ncbi:hypothetical protein ACQ4LE_000395 [Meloidogyne hapla]
MSSPLDQLFEHSLVLTSREPNFYEQAQHSGDGRYKLKMLEAAFSNDDFIDFEHCPHAKELLRQSNFISLLKIGWNKVYDQDPEFKTIFDPKDGIGDLEEQLLAGQWSQTASGRTKKLAQHKAAANVLLDIIKSGRHKEFLIPGRNAEEAFKLITTSMSSLLNEQIELMDVDNNGNNGGTIIKQGSVMSLQQQTNWVGRVQELIMKKRIVCKWNDAYTCENEKSNNIMHNCKLQFDILDASATKLERRLEADSQARNKKMAKQEAFRKIFEILNADYGPFNQINVVNENRKDREKKESVVTEMAGNEENLAVVEDKEQQDLPNNITTVNSTTDKYSLTLSPKDLIELSHIERSQDWDETIDIRMLLSDILNDREVNTPRSERLLRCILEWKNPQVERVFCQATLKFIETAKSQIYDIFQVYLEVWTNHNNKQTILCTFGGEGSDLQRARDDACWQALEYLYIFGGFAPKINKNGEE